MCYTYFRNYLPHFQRIDFLKQSSRHRNLAWLLPLVGPQQSDQYNTCMHCSIPEKLHRIPRTWLEIPRWCRVTPSWMWYSTLLLASPVVKQTACLTAALLFVQKYLPDTHPYKQQPITTPAVRDIPYVDNVSLSNMQVQYLYLAWSRLALFFTRHTISP